jgi:uncharacterized protein
VTARLRVRVHPGARGTRVRGWREDGVLRVDVAAPPEDGRANEALTRFLAEVLGLDRREVEVVRGHASRDKVVAVKGMEPHDLRSRIDGALDPGDESRGE